MQMVGRDESRPYYSIQPVMSHPACHSERSEESARCPQKILRCAQNDNLNGSTKRPISFNDGKPLVMISGLKARLPVESQRLLHILDDKARCTSEKNGLIVLYR